MLDPLSTGGGGSGAVIGYVAQSSNFNVLSSYRGKIIDVDTSGGNVTVTQIAAATAGSGFSYIIRKSTSDANTVILGTVDGGAKTLTKINEGRLIVSTGSAYISETWQDPAAVAISAGTINGTTIGATSATTGRFTTVESTIATGTAPLIIASTTAVANLNASLLLGKTWAIPDPIGATTPNTGKFTTVESTIATGTAPLTVASTTVVANLNVSQLLGATWTAPGTIGSGTPSTGAFTTISATGQITSTLATGSAPLVVASTTNVANLNASSLSGATFAAPGAIGSGTPSTGAFTTISASGQITSTVSTGSAPLVVASTTAVANLNASLLLGKTWAIPNPIGSSTPNTGAFLSLTSKIAAADTGCEAFGASAGAALTTGGTNNTFLGTSAGTAVSTGTDNTGFGYQAYLNATIAVGGTAVGSNALGRMIGSSNTGVGSGALRGSGTPANNTGTANVAVGNSTLALVSSGASNVAVGSTGLTALTTGSDNIAIGSGALVAITTVSGNVAIGSSALGAATTTEVQATAVGYQSLKALTTGVGNCAAGYQALTAATTSGFNTAFGYQTLFTVTTSDAFSTAVGYQALKAQSSGVSNTSVGYQCGVKISSGNQNTSMGESALAENQTTDNNVAFGWTAMWRMRGATNSAFGSGAMAGSGTAGNNTGANNVAVGYTALNVVTSGTENTALGAVALVGVTTGTLNTALGRHALHSMVSGSANIGIGAYAGYTATGSNTLYIGDTSQHASNYAIDTVTIASSNSGGPSVTNKMRWAGTQAFNAAVVFAPVALTDAATILVDASLGNLFRITLTASGHTLGSPSNGVDGQVLTFEITQDSTGSWTMLYHADYHMTTDCPAGTLSTAAGKTDIRSFRKIGSIWRAISPLMLNN